MFIPRKYSHILFILIYLILLTLFFRFIYQYTIRVPIADEFSINALITEPFNSSHFLTQLNEHRIGTTAVFLQFLSRLTHWNMIYETMSTGVCIFLSSLIALWLKKKYCKSIDLIDVIIPIIFLNFSQWENLIWGITINTVLPTFFLFIAVWVINHKETPWTNLALLVISFLSTYSAAHGLLITGIILLFFGWRLTQNIKKSKIYWLSYISYIIVLICIIFSYFIDFLSFPYFGPTTVDISFFTQFVALQITAAIGLPESMILIWIFPVGILISLWYFVTHHRYHSLTIQTLTIYLLMLYSCSFIFLIFIGRSGLGIDQATTSRYANCMSPLFFSLYLINRIRYQKPLTILYILLYFWFIFVSFLYRPEKIRLAKTFYEKTERWKTCYLQIKDYVQCNLAADLVTDNQEAIKADTESLKQFEEHRVNIFYKK